VWFCKDTNGDGKADIKEKAIENYGDRKDPEKTSNGLTWMLDNWIYSANHTSRYRFADGKYIAEASNFRGQWGATQDNYGRPYYNTNSDQLRTDRVDVSYYRRNPNFTGNGINDQVATSNATFPARINPGVNRGYRKGQLRDDGTLASFTAACGPGVYRGDLFPDWVGDIFIAEPSGNFVRRAKATEKNGMIFTENAYKDSEFIGGLDERFRPVNCYTGPDGALYIVDMQQGILQHRIYLTPFLKKQALERGLDKPGNAGRIWRVVPTKETVDNKSPSLEKASTALLVEALSHPNGWRRDTAQRLLVERQDKAAIPALRTLATSGKETLGRMHALYTLIGLNDADENTLTAALNDNDKYVRVAALKYSELLLKSPAASEWMEKIHALSKDKEPQVMLQAILSLGAVTDGKADDLFSALLANPGDHPLWNDAVVSGLAGREFGMITRLCADPAFAKASAHGKKTLVTLAKCVIAENKPGKISATLSLAAIQPAEGRWRTEAIIDGLLAAKSKNAKAGSITLKSTPDGWDLIEKDPTQKDRVKKITDWIAWSGNSASTKVMAAPKLIPEHQKLFDDGKSKYQQFCFACHQMNGKGLAGLAPPLAESEWVEGPHGRLSRIILHGVRGEITAAGVTFNLEMPSLGGALDDQTIAEIMTYVRNEWGNNAEAVTASDVKSVREAESKRGATWTAEELLKIK
jgi:mono/diheme cytochrome c family protein